MAKNVLKTTGSSSSRPTGFTTGYQRAAGDGRKKTIQSATNTIKAKSASNGMATKSATIGAAKPKSATTSTAKMNAATNSLAKKYTATMGSARKSATAKMNKK